MTLWIILPTLNEGDTLALRLHALEPLRARGAKVVVADGGSTDASWAIARAMADKVVLAPRGRAAQMNAGAQHVPTPASAMETLLFLHADTQLPPDADQLIAQALNEGHDWGRFDVRIEGRPPMLAVIAQMMNWRSRLTGIATGDQAFFMRRHVFEALGGFAPLPLMEDVDLSSRLRQRSAPACLRQTVTTSGRRWEKHGVWRTILLMWQLRAAYFCGADPHTLAQRYGYAGAPASATANLAIMAKAPVAGLAKTRLIPALGAAGAARAQRQFTRDTLTTAIAFAPKEQLALWCAPDTRHRFFRAVQRTIGIACCTQLTGDLGMRMQQACDHHFAQHVAQYGPSSAASTSLPMPLLIIGTDCPALSPGHLLQAALALTQHDVVIIPAEDGGYVLIGLRKPVPEVFENIHWSTPQVLAQTRERLQHAGASWVELPTLWDVDEPADWQRLQRLQHPSTPQ